MMDIDLCINEDPTHSLQFAVLINEIRILTSYICESAYFMAHMAPGAR